MYTLFVNWPEKSSPHPPLRAIIYEDKCKMTKMKTKLPKIFLFFKKILDEGARRMYEMRTTQFSDRPSK